MHESAVTIEQKTMETVVPIVGHAKHAAVKLTFAGVCFGVITAISTCSYVAIYYTMVPTIGQEAPVNFQWFTPTPD